MLETDTIPLTLMYHPDCVCVCVCVRACSFSDLAHMQRAPVYGSNWDIFISCLVDVSFLGHSFLV